MADISNWVFRRVSKITRSDCLLSHVGLSVFAFVLTEQLGSHWNDFRGISRLIIFRKSVEKIQVSVDLTRTTGTLHEDLCKFMIISCW